MITWALSLTISFGLIPFSLMYFISSKALLDQLQRRFQLLKLVFHKQRQGLNVVYMFIINNYCMPGIIPTMKTDYIIRFACEKVSYFPFLSPHKATIVVIFEE